MIKRSGKFDGKIYKHNDRVIRFQRVYGGLAWPGTDKGWLVVIGEEEHYADRHMYLLAEAYCDTADELITLANRITPELDVSQWYGRHVGGTREYLDHKNSQAFNAGKRNLSVYEAPGPENDDKLLFHVNILLDCVKPESKGLHFFEDSSLPAKLQGVQGQIHQMTCIDHPAVAALGYVVSEMVMHPYVFIDENDIYPEEEPDY